MALDFPSNPINGQIFGSYIWSAAKQAWQAREESKATAIMSPTVPSNAVSGDIWINTANGIAFVYYDDGTSSQWVEVLASPSANATTINSIDDIADVSTASVSRGNALVYDLGTNSWVPNKDTDAIKMNIQTISYNYTIPTGYNGMSAGPITIADGITVTIPDGSSWSIV